MKNACKIFLFVILLVASIAVSTRVSQFISHQPIGEIDSNEIPLKDSIRDDEGNPDSSRSVVASEEDNVIHIEDSSDSYFLEDFQGVVLSVEKLGLPPVESRHSNDIPLKNIIIQNKVNPDSSRSVVGSEEDNVIHIEDGYDSYFLDDFQGVVLSVENLGLPPVESRHSNSGQRLRITIKSVDGTIFIIDEFYSGIHAAAEIDSMVGQDFPFPDKLWRMRSSILFD